jgi:hypothetical protein
MVADDLLISDALLKLRQQHGLRVSYSKLWTAVVAGDVPAYRVGERWRINPADLPRIAEALGAPGDRTAA